MRSTLWQLRLLHPEDLPAWVHLRNASLRAYPDAFTSDYASEHTKPPEAFASRLGSAASGHFVLGAFATDATLLGTVALERDRDTRPQKRHLAQMTAVMVAEQAQRQGIGQALVLRCVELARQVPELDQLILTVTASNTHVVRVYEHAGFKAYGLLPRAICVDGVYHDKLHMRLALRENEPN
jgi:RimJ/RimL family protein N-acetyltransferase